jgi:hypothetical protein
MHNSINSFAEPDHFLEEFWNLFKSLAHTILYKNPIASTAGFDLDTWVVNLNIMKTNQEYVNIEKNIEKYIALTGWIAIKSYNHYQFSLYVTHIKRWQDVPSICFDDDIKRHNKQCGKYFSHLEDKSFSLYIQLLLNLTKNEHSFDNTFYSKLFDQLHIPDYDDKEDVISSCKYNMNHAFQILPTIIADKKGGAIDIMNNYFDLNQYFEDNYGINIRHKMQARKILMLLDKKNKQ